MITPAHYKQGIALYIAIIVAGITLLLAVAMAHIAVKQLVFARVSEDSQHAFYAADTAIECALYYDVGTSDVQFPLPSDDQAVIANFNDEIVCANNSVTPSARSDNGSVVTTFTLEDITTNPRSCADVRIKKTENVVGHPPVATTTDTKITASGHYRCGQPNETERTLVYFF